MIVLADSGAVLALLNKNDRYHLTAVSVLKDLTHQGASFCMTNYLVAECHALLLARLSPQGARRWLLTFDWNLIRATPEDEASAREIIGHYTDKQFSFTDAVSFAVMQAHDLKPAFTFDGHFRQFGLATIP
jgi:predicted nucleic acid-binding protein